LLCVTRFLGKLPLDGVPIPSTHVLVPAVCSEVAYEQVERFIPVAFWILERLDVLSVHNFPCGVFADDLADELVGIALPKVDEAGKRFLLSAVPAQPFVNDGFRAPRSNNDALGVSAHGAPLVMHDALPLRSALRDSDFS